MNRKWDFHESYYEHGCSVVTERDVLETDLKGNSFGVRMKRWWYGLFMLSYSNKYSRVFYTSSHTMRKERRLHYRKYRGRIHPFSTFRSFWEVFMFVVVMVVDVTRQHNFSLLYGSSLRFLHYLGAALDVIVIFDMFVNLSSGYINYTNKTVVMDVRPCVIHYCSTKLCLHAASAMPLQWLLFLRFGNRVDCSLCKTSKFVSALEMLRIFILFRIYECSGFLLRERSNFHVTYVFKSLRIMILAFFTLLQFLEMEKIITLRLMVETGNIRQDSNIGLLLTFKLKTESTNQNTLLLFVFNFSHVLRSMFLISFFYKIDIYYVDRIFRMLACIMGNIFIMWTIGETLALVSILKFDEDRERNVLVSMRLMERYRRIPDEVSAKEARYHDFKFARLRAVELRNHMYSNLPAVLKQEIYKECYAKLIRRIPYFVDWPPAIKRNLVHMLKEEIFMKNDLVADPCMQSVGLLIVVSGELAVFAADTETGHLIDGDFFGELSLVTDREKRLSSVVALTPCLLLLLRKSTFRQYMRKYPGLFFEMKEKLIKQYEARALSVPEHVFSEPQEPTKTSVSSDLNRVDDPAVLVGHKWIIFVFTFFRGIAYHNYETSVCWSIDTKDR